MRRPLLCAALLFVLAVWIRLSVWGEGAPPEDLREQIGLSAEEYDLPICFTGNVCMLEEGEIWLSHLRNFKISSISEMHSYQDAETSFESLHFPKHYKIILKTEETGSVRIGEKLTVSGIFMPFSRATNPGEFDGVKYYASLGAVGQLLQGEILAEGEGYWPIRNCAYKCRIILESRLRKLLPGEQGSVLCALLLGDKKGLDKDIKALYKRNGILHILSISSLHITIIGMTLYKRLRKWGVPILPSAVTGGLVLLFYGAMTGFSLSAVRAIGMFLLRMFADICGRTYDLLTALGVLAAGMVLYRPAYLWNAGFYLSFAAVAGIGIIYPIMKQEREVKDDLSESKRRKWLRKLWEYLQEQFTSSLSITLATLPVQLWFYYEIPVFSTIINLFVLPLVKPLLLFGFFSLVPGFGAVILADAGILSFYEWLCRLFDTSTVRTWNPGRPAVWQILLYYGLLGIMLWLKYYLKYNAQTGEKASKNKTAKASAVEIKKGKYEGILAAASLLCIFLFALPKGRGDMVTFLDVGQGNCVLIQNREGAVYLYDCGSSSKKNVGQYVLLPCLKYYGIQRIDAIFLSHRDNDHVNGVTELLRLTEAPRIEQLILPAIDSELREEEFEGIMRAADAYRQNGKTVRIAYLKKGDTFTCGQNNYTCLHPQGEYYNVDSNLCSLVMLVDFPECRLMLTGDIAGEEELEVAETYKANYKTYKPLLLQAAHHGSAYSGSEEFLKAVEPAITVISCGKGNLYGHPHQELLDRLQVVGSSIIRLDERGAVEMMLRGDKVKMNTWGK